MSFSKLPSLGTNMTIGLTWGLLHETMRTKAAMEALSRSFSLTHTLPTDNFARQETRKKGHYSSKSRLSADRGQG